MSLAPGARLGPYEVLSALGAGGMGEVYRARDTRLGRDVAIKILPELFAADADRVARFRREAQVLASLNHPHIAQIHGFEETDVMQALVLELVEGPTLAERIAQGPISLTEALPIAKQIVEALEAAHEQGIIHRDLKPANITLTNDGTVKVLDFGLAKAFTPEPGGGASGSASMSPTLTTPAMTAMGMILGTAAYMAPEQAKGKPADKRCDIWAFGCVLFEMFTGRRAFEGEGVTETLASILKGEPDWDAMPGETPSHVRALVKGCLEKDRKTRMGDISTARFVLDRGAGLGAAAPAVAPPVSSRPTWQRALPWTVACATTLTAATTLVLWAPWRSADAAPPVRVSVEPGIGAPIANVLSGGGAQAGASVAISSDGTQLAFVAEPRDGPRRIYLRRLDQLNATALPGTEGAIGPFFSSDGQSIGFFADGKLKKIAISGGAPVVLADAPSARGGSWGEDGTIVFSPGAVGSGGVWRIGGEGGIAEQLTTLGRGEVTHRWPQLLPDGRGVLYTVSAVTAAYADAWIAVQPLPSGTPQVVHRGGTYGAYVSSGHVTWVHEGTLFAAPFDLETLAVAGTAVPLVHSVMNSPTSGGANVAVSRSGTLLLVGGDNLGQRARFEWLSRDGKAVPFDMQPIEWGTVRISPDGRRLAFTVATGGGNDIWSYDTGRDALTRLTFDPASDRTPVWTPDGRRLVYSSSRSGATNLYLQPADGSGEAIRLTESRNSQSPGSWHPSGRFLAFAEIRPQTASDVMILELAGSETGGWKPGSSRPFVSGAFAEAEPKFSPDGNWLAYQSNESGRQEIYLRPFPGPGGRWQISVDGGTDAVWSRARPELLYRAADGRIMAVSYVARGASFEAEKPRVWSETAVHGRPLVGSSFDLHPDGERVVMAPLAEASAGPTHVTLMFNLFDELRRLAAVRSR